MNEITMLEFRQDAQAVLARLRNGEKLVLTYRGQAVARLEPIPSGRSAPVEGDALLRIEEYAVDGPGGVLDNATVDRTLYDAGAE